MLNKKAFLTFLFIVALGYLASWWIQSVTNVTWGPVQSLILFVGTPAIIYLLFHYISGRQSGQAQG